MSGTTQPRLEDAIPLVTIARNAAVDDLNLRRFLRTFPPAGIDAGRSVAATGAAQPSPASPLRLFMEISFYEGLTPMKGSPQSGVPLVTVTDWARMALSELKQRLNPALPETGTRKFARRRQQA